MRAANVATLERNDVAEIREVLRLQVGLASDAIANFTIRAVNERNPKGAAALMGVAFSGQKALVLILSALYKISQDEAAQRIAQSKALALKADHE